MIPESDTIKVSVLINNAGVVSGHSLATLPKEKLKQIFEVNVFAQFSIFQSLRSQVRRKKEDTHTPPSDSVTILYANLFFFLF